MALALTNWHWYGLGFASAFALLIFIRLVLALKVWRLYVMALLAGARIPLVNLVGMALRRTDINAIVLTRIRLVKAGLSNTPTLNQLEMHALAGGDVTAVATAVIAALHARIHFPWDLACTADLAGRDPHDLVLDAKARGLDTVEFLPA
ncbi:MAG: flotillin-like FloA family protein [Phycisphaerales bacterium]